jgi:hypothetical protein
MELHTATEENRLGLDIYVNVLYIHEKIFGSYFFYKIHIILEIFSLHHKRNLNTGWKRLHKFPLKSVVISNYMFSSVD